MRGAILPVAAAAVLSACATSTPPEIAARTPGADYSRLSCRQIAAELALTEKAYFSATRRERTPRGGETAQAFLFPASLGAAPPAASARLQARLDDLRRASRAKRCSSVLRETFTA